MGATANTAVSLSETYYLRRFYKTNRDAATASKRKEMSNNELSKADAEALRAAVRGLRDFNYEEDTTDGANIYSSVKAFLETYNNALDSSKSSSEYDVKRYAKQLKNLAKEYADELEDVGITVNSDGTLKHNENLLKAAKVDKISKLFGKDADFASKSSAYAKRINTIASDALFTEMTRKGSHINLRL